MLERPARDGYECTVARPAEMLGIDYWSGSFLGSLGGRTVLVRAEPEPASTSSRMVFSTVSEAGVLGEPLTLAQDSGLGSLDSPVGVAGPQRLDLVWRHNDGQTGQLFFAAVDEAGVLLSGPSAIEELNGNLSQPILIPGHEGPALLWTERDSANTRLMFGVLDEDGSMLKGPATLATYSSVSTVNGLVAVEGGYLATYSTVVTDGVDFRHESYLLSLDAEGNVENQTFLGRRGVSTFAGARDALLHRGDHVLIAWPEGGGSFGAVHEEQSGYIVLRLSRVEFDGRRRGDDVRLQAPSVHQAAIDAYFLEMDDDIGLLWSQGSIIYVCRGCVPDDHLNFVVLDGSDLTPKSNIVQLHNPETEGGLVAAQAQGIGDDILVVADVQHHVQTEAASGTLRCAPRP